MNLISSGKISFFYEKGVFLWAKWHLDNKSLLADNNPGTMDNITAISDNKPCSPVNTEQPPDNNQNPYHQNMEKSTYLC